MDVAHKHLDISPRQWDAFMQDAALTMQALHIDEATQAELGDIFTTFRAQVIVDRAAGERVPPDPKRCRKPPDGHSTYAQAGGVYPLASFVEALVELSLASADLAIRHDDVKKAGATRHAPGLTYLLTEVVCHAAGGPEVVTASGFDVVVVPSINVFLVDDPFRAFEGCAVGTAREGLVAFLRSGAPRAAAVAAAWSAFVEALCEPRAAFTKALGSTFCDASQDVASRAAMRASRGLARFGAFVGAAIRILFTRWQSVVRTFHQRFGQFVSGRTAVRAAWDARGILCACLGFFNSVEGVQGEWFQLG